MEQQPVVDVKQLQESMGITDEQMKMSEKDIDSLATALDANIDPLTKSRLAITDEEIEALREKGVVPGEATVLVDPTNGTSVPIMASDNDELAITDESIPNIIDVFNDKKKDITFDSCKTKLMEAYAASEEDAKVLFDMIMDDDLKEEEIYDKLPDSLKNAIKISTPAQYVDDTKTRCEFCAKLIENAKAEVAAEAEYIDLQRSLDKTARESEMMMDETLEYNREIMEVNILKEADNFEAQGYKDKAENIRKCSKAFKSARTLDILMTPTRTKKKPRSNKMMTLKEYLDSEVKLYDSHVARFCAKYQQIEKSITNPKVMVPILKSQFAFISEDDLKKFVILFCLKTQNMKPKNWADHTFMYYVVQNIVSMTKVKNIDCPYCKEMLDSIKTVVDWINKN